MTTKRSTISVTLDTVERLKELQQIVGDKNGFTPSITQLIDYLLKVESKVRDITEEK